MLLQRAAALINEKGILCRSGSRRAVRDESLEINQAPYLMARQGIATASQPLRAREPTAAVPEAGKPIFGKSAPTHT